MMPTLMMFLCQKKTNSGSEATKDFDLLTLLNISKEITENTVLLVLNLLSLRSNS